MLRATQAQVNLAHIAHNLRVFSVRLTQKKTGLMTVVKADAYGHGSVQVAKTALQSGASWLGVAIAEEGVALREAGIAASILVLGAPAFSDMEECVRYNLTQTVFDREHLRGIQHAARCVGKSADVHVKLDTGMHRIGLQGEEEICAFLEAAARCDNVRVTGVFTHFSNADAQDKDYTLMQGERFLRWLPFFRQRYDNLLTHACNSAAIAQFPQFHFDLVRLGIGLYGYAPSDSIGALLDLRPAMRLRSEVVRVCSIKKGESVGYGCAFTAQRDSCIATLPIGYGDGYPRILSGRAQVLVHGQRARVIGRVCMDQCMLDVTDIPDVQPGDEAVLWGGQVYDAGGGSAFADCISADEVGAWAETISYEILLGVSGRVPRVYK